MYFEQVARAARPLGVPCESRYVAFRDYPLSDLMRLLAGAAKACYPGRPTREALHLMGRDAFGTLMSSVAGRVMFTFALGDAHSALRLAPQAYKASVSHCSVRVPVCTPEQVVLELRNLWNFPECYQVGVLEAGSAAFGPLPHLKTRVLSACDVDVLVRW